MLKYIFTIISLGATLAWAQVGIGTTTPSSSAQLEVKSTSKGFLPPRIALTSLTDNSTISSPATGLLIYNTASAGTSPNNVTPGYYYWNGSSWSRMQENVNPGSFEWNYVKGSPTSNSGTLVGNASWISGMVELTPNTTWQNGKVYWNQDIDWEQPLHITAQVYAGGTSGGGDGTWIFWGCSSAAVGSGVFQSAGNTGISVYLNEYGTEAVTVYKNGTAIASLTPLQTIDNSFWYTVDLYFGKNPDGTRFLDVKTHSGDFLGTVQLGSFSPSGDYFGVGAWTGAANNGHYLRRLLIGSAVGQAR
jgi:hypothetical protein